MNTTTKYYAKASGADLNSLLAFLHKEFEQADSDDEMERLFIYSHTLLSR